MAMGRNKHVRTRDGAQYFIEAYTTPPQLMLCGGGHVSKSIAPLAKTLGFRLFITDDREEFANAERFPEADIIIPRKPEDAIPELPVNANTFIVIATRGHRYDNVALEAAAATNSRYVGLLGSKRKTILIYEELLKNGVPLERLQAVHAPVGLDIGAKTPEEIALSIVAEIVAFREGRSGKGMTMENRYLQRIAQKVGVPA
jgi:xanthine dehydrogenase accessory factor